MIIIIGSLLELDVAAGVFVLVGAQSKEQNHWLLVSIKLYPLRSPAGGASTLTPSPLLAIHLSHDI